MKKLFFIIAVFATLLLVKTPCLAESNIPLTGDEFLTKLSNSLFRVRNGFSHSRVVDAQHGVDSIVLSYNSSIFLAIQETPPPREIKNISVVLIAEDEDKEKTSERGGASPSDNIIFEDICMQTMYALHPYIKKDEIKKAMKELGFGGELLDGIQRSIRFEYCRYIIKYNSNGMLIMVVSGL